MQPPVMTTVPVQKWLYTQGESRVNILTEYSEYVFTLTIKTLIKCHTYIQMQSIDHWSTQARDEVSF